MDRRARNSCSLKYHIAMCNATRLLLHETVELPFNQSRFMSCPMMLLDGSSGLKHKDFNCDPSVRRLYREYRTGTLPNMATFFPPFSVQNKKSPRSYDPTYNHELFHAADGGRTRTLSPERDFKSLVSANFTTAAQKPSLQSPAASAKRKSWE